MATKKSAPKKKAAVKKKSAPKKKAAVKKKSAAKKTSAAKIEEVGYLVGTFRGKSLSEQLQHVAGMVERGERMSPAAVSLLKQGIQLLRIK